jgi:hypothetical protein
MNKGTKIGLSIAGLAIVGGAAFLVIRRMTAVNKLKKVIAEPTKEQIRAFMKLSKQEQEDYLKALEQQGGDGGAGTGGDAGTGGSIPTVGVIGMAAYPKGASVNVRSSAEVDNVMPTNIIYDNYAKRIGVVVAQEVQEGTSHIWYKIQLDEPKEMTGDVFGWLTDDFGYVRSDVVELKNS